MTADRVNFLNQADADAGLNQSVATSVSTAYTNSIFVKGEGTDIGKQIRVRIRRNTGTANTVTANITLTADWQRVSTNYTTLADNTSVQVVYSSAVGGAVTALIWQAQLETGSVATSPIVTTAGTASRVADVITLTSASSLIGQTANTLYVEGEIVTRTGNNDACIFALTDGTSDDAIVVRSIAANGRIGAVVRDGGSDQATIASGSFTTGVFKCAIASAVNDVAFYLNGSSVGTDTSATHPALSVFQFGGTVATVAPAARPVWFRAIADFPTRIANATLVTLTTL
jgi:hypothetical protein